MKILIVNAYPSSSKRGQEAFRAFRQNVVTMLRDEITHYDVTSFEIIVCGCLTDSKIQTDLVHRAVRKRVGRN